MFVLHKFIVVIWTIAKMADQRCHQVIGVCCQLLQITAVTGQMSWRQRRKLIHTLFRKTWFNKKEGGGPPCFVALAAITFSVGREGGREGGEGGREGG